MFSQDVKSGRCCRDNSVDFQADQFFVAPTCSFKTLFPITTCDANAPATIKESEAVMDEDEAEVIRSEYWRI